MKIILSFLRSVPASQELTLSLPPSGVTPRADSNGAGSENPTHGPATPWWHIRCCCYLWRCVLAIYRILKLGCGGYHRTWWIRGCHYRSARSQGAFGLFISSTFLWFKLNLWTRSPQDCMYREACDPWDALERRLYSLQGDPQ